MRLAGRALLFAACLAGVSCDDQAGAPAGGGDALGDAERPDDARVEDAARDAMADAMGRRSDRGVDGMVDDMGALDADLRDAMVGDGMWLDGAGGDALADDATVVDAATGDAMVDDAMAGDAGPMAPPPLFDLAFLRDPSTLDCQFERPRQTLRSGVALDVWNVSYVSYEARDGALHPIRIRGFAARPLGAAPLPGIIQAHGLGGFAEESHATGPASLLHAFVLAYTGPGGGNAPENTSEGLPAGHDNGRRMFDVVPDLRGSWFWGHAVAAMRGLGCLAQHPDVDPERLGMTGYSAGAVATLIATGVDDRIKVAVPLSGTGAWGEAVRSPTAWQHGLLTQAGLDVNSVEWLTLLENLDAAQLIAGTRAHVLMVNGSTDEFFPLTAHVATYANVPDPEKRTSISANYDHGCYAISGVEPANVIEERARVHAEGGQLMWFSHYFGLDPFFEHVPPAPTLALQPAGAAAVAVATVGDPGAGLEVESVRYWWSNDSAWLFGAVDLDDQGGGLYGGLVPAPDGNTVYYIDVQYRTRQLLTPRSFSLSSVPVIPPGFVPRIRANENCL
ncbi:MAG: acetylxylan esterase [Myxococcales bacterium]|nr:acetylxylan esterase [Myxococcales bacterium]